MWANDGAYQASHATQPALSAGHGGDYLSGVSVHSGMGSQLEWPCAGASQRGGTQPLTIVETEPCRSTSSPGLSGIDAVHSPDGVAVQELVKLTDCSWKLCAHALQASGEDLHRCMIQNTFSFFLGCF
jgi:hypothetical protein